ncbi:MAG: capsule biosynthesis protein CapA [Marinosulfonomonas sp.]|nr:MAG: capsule biosynthesis protein CapA [Marinosulfonomonas sp.]
MSSNVIATGAGRRFLFLQGPHGPFFSQLGKMLGASGASVIRVGFNAGDQAFWRNRNSYIAFRAPLSEWPSHLAEVISNNRITDIVLYGDTRPVHAKAISLARDIGLTVHVFEEGYLRPFWVTYERGGSNGNSRLMDMSVGKMRCRLSQAKADNEQTPDHWGDMREHVFYGALYHWFLLFRNRKYRNFKSHRSISVGQEFSLHLKRLLLMPAHWAGRVMATRRIKRGGFPYHLALLQLEHDASFQAHSPFATMTEFLQLVVESFAKGAPTHHHLVFKAHPLEDGRVPIEDEICGLALENGISDRVHFLRGGKLARLLDAAQTAVSVNSTAVQQALWRGLPVRTFGDAVYNKPEFVSEQGLADFFRAPNRPDIAAYRDYRHYLLETSQVTGGFYAARSRRQLLRNVVDMMLHHKDPYDALKVPTAAPAQQLRVVK